MDREKVIKGLELCLKTIDEPDCRKECPYYEACQKYEGRVIFQPLMRDTLALLKEQEIVRCKDCTFGRPAKDESGSDAVRCFSDVHPLDWFCADCVRKTS